MKVSLFVLHSLVGMLILMVPGCNKEYLHGFNSVLLNFIHLSTASVAGCNCLYFEYPRIDLNRCFHGFTWTVINHALENWNCFVSTLFAVIILYPLSGTREGRTRFHIGQRHSDHILSVQQVSKQTHFPRSIRHLSGYESVFPRCRPGSSPGLPLSKGCARDLFLLSNCCVRTAEPVFVLTMKAS